MARSPTYKLQPAKMGVEEAISGAFDEAEELAQEMREWHDNLEGGNLGHTDKAQQVGEVADTLENLDRPEWPDSFTEAGLHDREIIVGIMVKVKNKRTPPSRATRRDNITAKMNAAIKSMRDWADDEEKSLEEARENDNTEEAQEASDGAKALVEQMRSEREDLIQNVRDFTDRLEEAASGLDGVDFPGMY